MSCCFDDSRAQRVRPVIGAAKAGWVFARRDVMQRCDDLRLFSARPESNSCVAPAREIRLSMPNSTQVVAS